MNLHRPIPTILSYGTRGQQLTVILRSDWFWGTVDNNQLPWQAIILSYLSRGTPSTTPLHLNSGFV